MVRRHRFDWSTMPEEDSPVSERLNIRQSTLQGDIQKLAGPHFATLPLPLREMIYDMVLLSDDIEGSVLNGHSVVKVGDGRTGINIFMSVISPSNAKTWHARVGAAVERINLLALSATSSFFRGETLRHLCRKVHFAFNNANSFWAFFWNGSAALATLLLEPKIDGRTEKLIIPDAYVRLLHQSLHIKDKYKHKAPVGHHVFEIIQQINATVTTSEGERYRELIQLGEMVMMKYGV